MTGDRPVSPEFKADRSDQRPDRSDAGHPPEPHVADRAVEPGDTPPRALSRGEFPNKYGVSADEFWGDVAVHARRASSLGEAVGKLSEEVAGLTTAQELHRHPGQALRRNDHTAAAGSDEQVTEDERGLPAISDYLERMRTEMRGERWEAMTAARGQYETSEEPQKPDLALTVAQTCRDLADQYLVGEVVLNGPAFYHLVQADEWASRAAEHSLGSEPLRVRTAGFQAEVYERFGYLRTLFAQRDRNWLTRADIGAIPYYKRAVSRYRDIHDHDAEQRVTRLVEDLMPGRDQDAQGS